MRIFNKILPVVFICFAFSSSAQNFSKDELKFIKKFSKAITGFYDNKKQAEETDIPYLQHTHSLMFPIMKHKKDEFWFSIGWYQPGVMDKPMGEKILHLNKMEDGKFWIDVYSIPPDMEDRPFMEWKKSNPYGELNVNDLAKDNCKMMLTEKEDGSGYIMQNPEGTSCPLPTPVGNFNAVWFQFEFNRKNFVSKNKHLKPDGSVAFEYTDTPLMMLKIKSNPKTF